EPQAEFRSNLFYLIVDRRSLIDQAIEFRLQFSIRHSRQRRQPCFPTGSPRQCAHPRQDAWTYTGQREPMGIRETSDLANGGMPAFKLCPNCLTDAERK